MTDGTDGLNPCGYGAFITGLSVLYAARAFVPTLEGNNAMYDPDEGDKRQEELDALDKTLAALQSKDLTEWDTDFVDNMTDRVAKLGTRINVTGSQWEQIERMRNQYNVK